MRPLRGLVLVATLGAAAAGSVTLPAAPAEGAGGRCAPGTGVTVVVDYGELTDYTELGCDPAGANVAAQTVVPRAGFPLDYVGSQPFVCRIKGLPDASSESCGDIPPGNAYWGLFWSDGKSASWKYSSSGVHQLKVPEGGSIGWRFQNGGALDYPDQAPTLTPAKPKPSPSPSKTPTPKPTDPPNSPAPAPTSKPPASSAPPSTEEPDSSPTSSGVPARKTDGRTDGGAGNGGGKTAGGAGQRDGGREKRDSGDKRRSDRSSGQSKRGQSPASLESTADDSEIVAIEPASGEPLTREESSTGLTLLAGAAVLLLGAAAGVIAWRRRV